MRFDLPFIEDETEPYWSALREGTLLLRRCRACGASHHYPRPVCPSCWSEDVAWVPASGRATLYTYSVIHVNDLPPFGEQVPYVAAVVDLEEGPRMMTRVVDCAEADLAVDMPLEVTVVAVDDEVSMAVFRPA